MAYPFVQARYDIHGARRAAALAMVVHMAEGGNTVGYLARNPMRKVSVHFVIEYSGRIVQMLREDRVSGSINPNDLRRTNDTPFRGYNGETIRFGITAAKAVLGGWWTNPNHAILTVEVEGFAAKGPNLAQRKSLVLLSRDLFDRHPTLRGTLGHRDFTYRKACPGKLIPWANMAGRRHGLRRP